MKWPYFSDQHFAEEGQGLIEYALILVLISIVVWLFLQGIGLESKNVYSNINSILSEAAN